MTPLSGSELRRLRSNAQRLKAMLKVGKQGLTPQFLQSVDEVLRHHPLVKIKFDEFKDQRKTLAPELAEKTGSHLVALVGHVVVLYRPKPETETAPENDAGE